MESTTCRAVAVVSEQHLEDEWLGQQTGQIRGRTEHESGENSSRITERLEISRHTKRAGATELWIPRGTRNALTNRSGYQRHRGHWLKIGTFNVRSIRQRLDEVSQIMSEEALDGIALQETFLSPEQGVSISDQCVYLNNSPGQQRYRAPGGSMIIVRKNLRFRLLRKTVIDRCELIVIKIAGCVLASIYSPPSRNNESWKSIEKALEIVCELSTGAAMVIGDFNARHKDWCHGTNARGRSLVRWAEQRRWKITAPLSA